MGNKDQRRGNREIRKPKQAKVPPAVQASTFAETRDRPGGPKKS